METTKNIRASRQQTSKELRQLTKNMKRHMRSTTLYNHRVSRYSTRKITSNDLYLIRTLSTMNCDDLIELSMHIESLLINEECTTPITSKAVKGYIRSANLSHRRKQELQKIYEIANLILVKKNVDENPPTRKSIVLYKNLMSID